MAVLSAYGAKAERYNPSETDLRDRRRGAKPSGPQPRGSNRLPMQKNFSKESISVGIMDPPMISLTVGDGVGEKGGRERVLELLTFLLTMLPLLFSIPVKPIDAYMA